MAEWTKGIDVSRWQGVIDWKKAAAQGVRFAFIKASQNQFTDERFAANWAGAGQEGILRGAYHFNDYRYRAAGQAEYLYRTVKAAGHLGELPYVLDVEQLWQPVPQGRNMLVWMQEFFEAADDLFGRKGMLYCNPSGLQHWLGLRSLPDFLQGRPLWLAHYGVVKPDHRPFPDWTFWQYSAKGDGLAHGMQSMDLDMNWFNGSYADLIAFAGLGGSVPELELEEKVDRLWRAHPELWG